MPKTKKVLKTKEQIMKEMTNNSRFKARLKFAKETFWPGLVEVSKSVDDAKMLLGSFNSVMMEKFLSFMRDKRFSELKLEESLDKKDPDYEKYVKFLSMFSEMSVFDAKDHIEGMRGEIDTFLNEEMRERKLDTLKVRWIDDIVK